MYGCHGLHAYQVSTQWNSLSKTCPFIRTPAGETSSSRFPRCLRSCTEAVCTNSRWLKRFTLQSSRNTAGPMVDLRAVFGEGRCFCKSLTVNEWTCFRGRRDRQWQYQLLLHTHCEHSHPLFHTKGASYHGNAVFGLMYGWTWNSKRDCGLLETRLILLSHSHSSLILIFLSWNSCCVCGSRTKGRRRNEQNREGDIWRYRLLEVN